MPSDNNNGDSPSNDTDTRQTAMLIFRDDGVDWTQLAVEGRSKALFQKLVDWAADLKRRGLYAGVESSVRRIVAIARSATAGLISSAVGERGILTFSPSWRAFPTPRLSRRVL